jgi:hypothetical protein
MHLLSILKKKSSSNVAEATLQLVKHLGIPVTATTVAGTLENHPHFPSLYSISDSLNHWKVENAAFELDVDKLDQLPTPFIAHTRRGGGNFVLVSNMNGSVELVNERGKKETLSREDFVKDWTNTILLAEKSETSAETAFPAKQREEWLNSNPHALSGGYGPAVCCRFCMDARNPTLWWCRHPLLLLKLMVTVVAGFLLWFGVGKQNPLLQQSYNGLVLFFIGSKIEFHQKGGTSSHPS